MRLARLTVAYGILVCLGFSPLAAPCQEAPPADSPEQAAPPIAQDVLERLLTLTPEQQRQRARELIRDYPDTELARVLRRLLNEYETFQALDEQERQAREARAAWGRAYWRARCCPLPAWSPPVGRIVNETGTPVLYEQRIEGIHHTRWSGPYRLSVGGSHESPHPFLVRYIAGGNVVACVIVPGDVYAFRGSPDDGTLTLVPAGTTLGTNGPAVPAPPQPSEPMATEGDGAAEGVDGPMIAP